MTERKKEKPVRGSVKAAPPVRREGEAVPVIIGYNLKMQGTADLHVRLRDHFAQTVSAPSNYKDPEKIAAYCATALEEYNEAAKQQPYSATFKAIRLVAPTLRQAMAWSLYGPESESPAAQVAAWITANWPVYLYGFDIDLFIDVLYTECARERYRLPTALWLDRMNRPCRDIARCLVPSGYGKFLTPTMALMTFGSLGGIQTEGYTPGVDPVDDTKLVYELLVRLDIIQPAS